MDVGDIYIAYRSKLFGNRSSYSAPVVILCVADRRCGYEKYIRRPVLR